MPVDRNVLWMLRSHGISDILIRGSLTAYTFKADKITTHCGVFISVQYLVINTRKFPMWFCHVLIGSAYYSFHQGVPESE